MLGNFSIGDYFLKQEAIEFAWEFLTSDKWMGMVSQINWNVTIHPEDMEAYNIWHKDIGLEESRIIRIEGNFWDIGEITFQDRTRRFSMIAEKHMDKTIRQKKCIQVEKMKRYLEVWNLVFSEFNHNKDHSYTPLPNKNIDTGMGLERMASVSQNVRTNYLNRFIYAYNE